MQKQRDILELCFNELTHDRNTLRNLSSMAPRTFQRNMEKLENGERLGKNPKTKQELIEAIQNSKSVITREIRENLMNSVGKRLKSCKRLQGELI